MPNIEIHGLKHYERLAADIQKQIFEVTKELPFAKDIVVTIVWDDCRDRDQAARPFLRIIDTPGGRLLKLVLHLQTKLDVDMEVLEIQNFYEGNFVVPF
jgi:hypothetical protein